MSNVSDPASYSATVVPDDVVVLADPTRSLHVSVSGSLRVRMWPSGIDQTFPSVPAGILPVRVDKVFQTGTSATGIVALWG
jgi:hypothetical protein